MELRGFVRRDAFFDSVALMRISEQLRALPGVEDAAAVMATELNREMLADARLLTDDARAAGPGDLVVAVRAASSEAAGTALARADVLLATPRADASGDGEVAPRSIRSAARRMERPAVAVISVPGPFAAGEAHQALAAGLHVFLFSDAVPVADEVALKRRAIARGLIVMGPECGTSVVHGIGLGFANRVRRGSIGLVGASGTGLQEVATLVHRLGGGVSHAIGTGGRDLHEPVGGLTTLQALAWLADDRDTRAIVIVSKPPSDAVARRVLDAAAQADKPVIACLLGWTGMAPAPIRLARSLEEAARAALEATGAPGPPLTEPLPGAPAPGRIRGLFTGGSLCEEAEAVAGPGHAFTDFGAAAYTRGRPHPMIDPGLRNAAVAAAGTDASIGVILVDVVLGDGVHPDPAGALAPAIAQARASAAGAGRRLAVVAHVVGTEDDPQRLSDQDGKLRTAGAVVCPTNRAAAALALRLAGGA